MDQTERYTLCQSDRAYHDRRDGSGPLDQASFRALVRWAGHENHGAYLAGRPFPQSPLPALIIQIGNKRRIAPRVIMAQASDLLFFSASWCEAVAPNPAGDLWRPFGTFRVSLQYPDRVEAHDCLGGYPVCSTLASAAWLDLPDCTFDLVRRLDLYHPEEPARVVRSGVQVHEWTTITTAESDGLAAIPRTLTLARAEFPALFAIGHQVFFRDTVLRLKAARRPAGIEPIGNTKCLVRLRTDPEDA